MNKDYDDVKTRLNKKFGMPTKETDLYSLLRTLADRYISDGVLHKINVSVERDPLLGLITLEFILYSDNNVSTIYVKRFQDEEFLTLYDLPITQQCDILDEFLQEAFGHHLTERESRGV